MPGMSVTAPDVEGMETEKPLPSECFKAAEDPDQSAVSVLFHNQREEVDAFMVRYALLNKEQSIYTLLTFGLQLAL